MFIYVYIYITVKDYINPETSVFVSLTLDPTIRPTFGLLQREVAVAPDAGTSSPGAPPSSRCLRPQADHPSVYL